MGEPLQDKDCRGRTALQQEQASSMRGRLPPPASLVRIQEAGPAAPAVSAVAEDTVSVRCKGLQVPGQLVLSWSLERRRNAGTEAFRLLTSI
jgi:hypothetical protein